MKPVETSVRGRIAEVTIDNPPLNVLDMGTSAALAEAFEGLRGAGDIGVAVLRSRGRAFCAGVDVASHLPDRGEAMLKIFHRACLAILALEVPTVALVHGAALGGGCELVLSCDLAWASQSATLGVPEIRLGVFPPVAAVALPRQVGPRHAADLLLTGRIVQAEEAARIGLVNRVFPDAEFEAGVEKMIANLAGLSPAALQVAKRALRLSGTHATPQEVEAAEGIYLSERLHAADAIEGLTAFMEKRPPAVGEIMK